MSDIITPIAENITQQLNGGGIALSFKSDSLLAPVAGEVQLIAESHSGEASLESLVAGVNEYFEGTNPNPFGVSMEEISLGNSFNAGVESVLNDIEPIAVGILAKIKDHVIPTTNDIFECAFAKTSETVDSGGIKLDITTDGLESPIWSNVALASIIDSYAELGEMGDTRTVGFSFPSLSTEELTAAVSSVNPTLNDDLQALLGLDYECYLQNTYKHVFNLEGSEPIKWSGIYGDALKSKVVALLLAIAFSENIPEGVDGEGGLEAYNTVVRKVIACMALHLRNAVAYANNIARSGLLIREFPPEGSEFTAGASIVVCGINYEKWLNNGGNVDAIYGSYVSDQNVNGDALLENLTRYEHAWVRHVATKQSSIRDNFESVFVNALRAGIYGYAAQQNLSVNEDVIAEMYNRTSNIDPSNAYAFARGVICKAIYGEGDFINILETVDNIATDSPDLDLGSAIEIATVEWLVDWALDQIKITRID